MSVAVKENLQESLVEITNELTVESLAAVVDFAEFLREKKRRNRIEQTQTKERVFGMYEGQGWISDDFNNELPDEFCFGGDSGVIEKDKNNEFPARYTHFYPVANCG